MSVDFTINETLTVAFVSKPSLRNIILEPIPHLEARAVENIPHKIQPELLFSTVVTLSCMPIDV
jgi:hypothetical protein